MKQAKLWPAMLGGWILVATPLTLYAGDVQFSGFSVLDYGLVDDATSNGTAMGIYAVPGTVEGRFDIQGELDVSAHMGRMSGRLDIDASHASRAGKSQDKANLEQAHFRWQTGDWSALQGGIMNSPVGYEAEDATDLPYRSHGQIWQLLDNATEIQGNNISGLLLDSKLGNLKLKLGLLNNISSTANNNNSYLISLGGALNKHLDIEASYLSGSAKSGKLGNMIDANLRYRVAGWTIAGEYLVPDQVLDAAWAAYASWVIDDTWSLHARYDSLTSTRLADSQSYTLTLSAEADTHLNWLLEFRRDDNGSQPNTDQLQLRAVWAFGVD